MPPKGRAKGKKGNHPPPQESRQVIRRREQEKKKDAKKLAISLKNLKKEQKLKKSVSSASCDKDNQESFQHQTGDKESELEDINLPHSSRKEPSTSRTVKQQINLQNESSKKTGNDSTPVKVMPPIKLKGSDINVPKNITESKKLSRNIDKTGQVNLQNVPLNYSVGKKKSQGEQAKTQVEIEKKESVVKGAKKFANVVNSASKTPKRDPSKVQRKTTEDVPNSIQNMLEHCLEENQTHLKFFDDDTKKRIPYYKEKKTAIKGYMRALEKDECVNKGDEDILTYSFFVTDKRVMCIGDENIKVSFLVHPGNQIVCNTRRLSTIDLNQSAESCSGPLERTDKGVKTDSEKCDETTREAECDSSYFGEFSNRHYQTVGNQSTDNSGTSCLRDSEKHETSNDMKSNFSKENDPSVILSVREKIRKICNDYLRDLHSTCEKFQTRVENQIKGDSLKSTEI